jgi:hypothetical protein
MDRRGSVAGGDDRPDERSGAVGLAARAGALADGAGRRLLAAPVVVVAVAGVVLALVHNGVGAYPFAGYFATDVAPTWPDLPGDVPALFQYVLWSPIGPALARLLGIGSRAPYLALHAAVLAGGLAAFAVIVQRRFGAIATRSALVVVAVAPAVTVVLAWSGGYDVFTVVLALLLVVCPSSRWAAVLGALLAASALEHGAIVIALLGLLAVCGVWGELRPMLAAAGGLVAGGIVLVVWLRAQDIEHGRAYWLDHFGPRYFLRMTGQGWPLLLVGAFAALWPLAIALVVHAPTGRRLAVAVALAVPVLPTLVTEDQTRVFAVLTLPVLVALTLAQTNRDPAPLRRPFAIAVALALLTPGFFVWKGSPHVADWGPWTALLR